MKFVEDQAETGLVVRRYAPGEVVIEATTYTSPLVLSAEHILSPWPGGESGVLCEAAYAAMLELSPEIIIVGTGAVQQFPPAKVLQAVIAAQIGIEHMTTAAACRTFNILRAEGRHVVAGLIP